MKLLILLMLLNEFLSLLGLLFAQRLASMLMLAIQIFDFFAMLSAKPPLLCRLLFFELIDFFLPILLDLLVPCPSVVSEGLQFLVQEPVSLPFFPRFSSRSRSSASARKLACCRVVVGIVSRLSIQVRTRWIVEASKIDHAAKPKIASR